RLADRRDPRSAVRRRTRPSCRRSRRERELPEALPESLFSWKESYSASPEQTGRNLPAPSRRPIQRVATVIREGQIARRRRRWRLWALVWLAIANALLWATLA